MLDAQRNNLYTVFIVQNSKRKLIWSDVVAAKDKNEAIRLGLYLFAKKTGAKITKKFLLYFSVDATPVD